MRGGSWWIWTVWLLLAVAGCRIPGLDGPVSRSLATSRQLCQQGMVAMEREQWQRAEQLLQQAVKTCSTDADSRRSYAEALWHRGAQEDAAAQMERACELAPGDAELHVRTAEMYLAMKQMDPAINHTRQALELAPRLASAWAMRARIMQTGDQLQEALASFHRALGYAPNDRGIRFETAQLYLRMDQPARALVILQNMAETYSPGEEPPWLFYAEGHAYKAMHRYDDAIQSFATAKARGAPLAETQCQLAECLMAVGRAADAASAAREALMADPQCQQGRELLARIETAQRQDNAARR